MKTIPLAKVLSVDPTLTFTTASPIKRPTLDALANDIVNSLFEKELSKINKFKVKNIYFNKEKGVTTVLWEDRTVTMVTCGKDDVWDEEKAIALCFMKRAFDNKGKYNEVLKKYCNYDT